MTYLLFFYQKREQMVADFEQKRTDVEQSLNR